MTPTNFTSNIVDEYGKTELRVTYAAGVAEGSIIKEFPRKHKLLPVNDADRRGVTDPLSAVLIRANTRDGVLESANCNRVLLIFDGQRRYNLMLAYVRLTGEPAHAEKRIALVVGNAAYQEAPLKNTANDAGLIAQTLQAAGFDVVGARDLDQDTLRRSFRDFLEKAAGSGTDTVAFIYFAGYGLQLEGENYLVPIDARIARDTDVAVSAVRVSDYLRPLAALKQKASIVVLDAAHPNPFARSGPPLAGGLALVEPEPGLLLAYNAAPGTVAPEGSGSYGALRVANNRTPALR
jgi:Caspase domain